MIKKCKTLVQLGVASQQMVTDEDDYDWEEETELVCLVSTVLKSFSTFHSNVSLYCTQIFFCPPLKSFSEFTTNRLLPFTTKLL